METKAELRTSEPKPEASPDTVQAVRLKPGSYRLHIYIEEARSLIPPNNNDVSDPVFIISAFTASKSTRSFENIGSISTIPISEHIYIDASHKTPEEILNERVLITVKDQKTHLLGHSLIGVYEIDMTYIYSSPAHSILHRWVVLSNPEEKNYDVMRGYLKIGLSLLHEEDKPVDLACKEDPGEKDKNLMIPPHVKPKTVQLIIQLLKAENLPVMDKGKTLDAYCIARFTAAECRSSTLEADKATLSAYWYEELMLPVLTPCVTSTVSLTFWDHDALSKDDLVGAIDLNFDKIKKGKLKDYFWANIYGAPPLSEGQQAEYMNRVPSAGSHWRGRVLLKTWVVEDCKETYKKCTPIKEPGIQVKIRDEFETGQDFEMRTQIYSATALPFRKGKFSVKVEWSGLMVSSSIIQTENGHADWFETCKRQIAIIPKHADVVMPDVFIYLLYENLKICFARVPAKEFSDKTQPASWRQLMPDKSVGKVREDWNAGFVKVRIYIGPYDLDRDDPGEFNWKRLQKPTFEDYFLHMHLFQCRNLPAADKNGLSDPYVQLYCAGNEVGTKDHPRECTLNPRWYETLVLQVSILSVQEAAPAVLYVYDYDEIGDDDILGVAIVDIQEAALDAEAAPRPRWRTLNLGRKGTEKGEILVSFTLTKNAVQTDFQIMPEFEDKNIDVNILGLRDLKPAVGWLPVNKAFVKFDLNSLNLPGESIGIKIIETQPFEPGSDPNITSTVSFKCKMPRDKIFAPILTCTVHDYLFSGLSQPLIGSFGIELARYTMKYVAPVILTSAFTLQRLQSQGTKAIALRHIQELPEEEETKLEVEEKVIEKKEVSEKNEEKGKDLSEIEEEKHFTQEITETDEKSQLLPVPERKTVEELSEGRSQRSLSQEARQHFENKKKQIIESLSQVPDLTFEEICSDIARIKHHALYETKKNARKEVCQPDPRFYLPIGYNQTATDETKYYRYYYGEELEKTSMFDDLPFEEIPIYRGQERQINDSIFSFGRPTIDPSEHSPLEVVGKFKATIRVTEYPPRREDDEFTAITRMLLTKTKCIVRVYIIDAFDLEQKDRFSLSDPFVKLKLAGKVISDRDNHQEDICNPKIYRGFEMSTTLPGQSMLKVQMWDYNKLTTDSKIGTTRIDLEDRYFNKKWLELKEKPIETRALYVRSDRRPQGFLRLWLEIIPGKRDKLNPLEEISLRPSGHFEARVIVWRAVDVPNMDLEGLSDIFVAIKINSMQEKETDTHYRASHSACWNWRMKFSLTLPQDRNILTVQLWDKDILSGNDFISEASICFDDIAAEAWESDRAVQMLGESQDLKDRVIGKKREVFWVQCKRRNDSGVEVNAGKVLISFEILPKKRADNFLVGEGRDDPNVNPFLPPPTGRLKLSWNPFSLLFQMVGPEFRNKLCLLICCVFLCLCVFFIIPMAFSEKISSLLFSWF